MYKARTKINGTRGGGFLDDIRALKPKQMAPRLELPARLRKYHQCNDFRYNPTDTTTTLGRHALLHFHWVFATISQLKTPHIGLILSLVIVLATRYARSPWRKVPPSPKGLPILGNALQLSDKL